MAQVVLLWTIRTEILPCVSLIPERKLGIVRMTPRFESMPSKPRVFLELYRPSTIGDKFGLTQVNRPELVLPRFLKLMQLGLPRTSKLQRKRCWALGCRGPPSQPPPWGRPGPELPLKKMLRYNFFLIHPFCGNPSRQELMSWKRCRPQKAYFEFLRRDFTLQIS